MIFVSFTHSEQHVFYVTGNNWVSTCLVMMFAGLWSSLCQLAKGSLRPVPYDWQVLRAGKRLDLWPQRRMAVLQLRGLQPQLLHGRRGLVQYGHLSRHNDDGRHHWVSRQLYLARWRRLTWRVVLYVLCCFMESWIEMLVVFVLSTVRQRPCHMEGSYSWKLLGLH